LYIYFNGQGFKTNVFNDGVAAARFLLDFDFTDKYCQFPQLFPQIQTRKELKIDFLQSAIRVSTLVVGYADQEYRCQNRKTISHMKTEKVSSNMKKLHGAVAPCIKTAAITE
jgi:hypothetical protein